MQKHLKIESDYEFSTLVNKAQKQDVCSLVYTLHVGMLLTGLKNTKISVFSVHH